MKSNESRGCLITFEGGNGSGKSTQLKMLAEAFRELDIPHVTTREPGGDTGSEAIRSLLLNGEVGAWDPEAELLLHTAARIQHVNRFIRPAMVDKVVLCDRFFDSSVAYQGYGQGLGVDLVRRVTETAIGSFTPRLTLLYDIAPDVGLRRTALRERNITRYEQMDLEFHTRVRNGFLRIAAEDPNRVRVINAEKAIDEVFSITLISALNRIPLFLMPHLFIRADVDSILATDRMMEYLRQKKVVTV